MDTPKSRAKQTAAKHPSSINHRILQKSATLNRRFVKRPAAIPRILKQSEITKAKQARREALAEKINREKLAKLKEANETTTDIHDKAQLQAENTAAAPNRAVAQANAAVAARKANHPQSKPLSAQELKNRAISQAMQSLATTNDQEKDSPQSISKVIPKKKGLWQTKKFFIAAAVSLASIATLGYLVHLNLPDLSVKVAALQSGIESAYPSYVPRGYYLNGLVSEKNGKITMNFNNNNQDTYFTISEQKSPWDSTALLTQFVLPEWGDEYTLTKEQGLSIYNHDSKAAWVNGGVFYLIEAPNKTLTRQQLRDIAISL